MSYELLQKLAKLLDNEEAKLEYPTIAANDKQEVYVYGIYKKILPLAQNVFRLTPNERTAFNEILAALDDSRDKK